MTRRPRSRGDGPFGVRTSITIRRIVPSPVEVELGVAPAHERPAVHPVRDQPRGRALDALDGDGVVAEDGDEAVALGGRRVTAGEKNERENDRSLHSRSFMLAGFV